MKSLITFLFCLLTITHAFSQTMVPSQTTPVSILDNMVLTESKENGHSLVYQIPGELYLYPEVASIKSIEHCFTVIDQDTFYVLKWVTLNPWVRPMTPAWNWWYQTSCDLFGTPVIASDGTLCWGTPYKTGAYLRAGDGNSNGAMFFMATP